MNLEEQLSSVLNDPEAMSKISSIISSLNLGNETASSQPKQEGQPQQQRLPQPSGGIDLSGDNRVKLLMAVKPFLSEKRAPYVDGAIAIMKMMQLGKLGKDMKLF